MDAEDDINPSDAELERWVSKWKTKPPIDQAGMKFDNSKNRLDLIEPEFLESLAAVLTYGAKKYAVNNWQKVADGPDRYYAALLRHLLAYRRGELIDPESNLSHLSHVACNVMFLMHFERLSV
jgi:hypothetical protein